RNTFAILEKLETWRLSGSTILMVTHDLRIVKHFATEVWHGQDGQVAIHEEPDDYLSMAEQQRFAGRDRQEQAVDASTIGHDDATNSTMRTSSGKELVHR